MACGSSPSPIIDGIPYLVHPQLLTKVIGSTAESRPTPVVLLSINDAISSVDKALALIDRFSGVDDVYSQGFAHTAILQGSTEAGIALDSLISSEPLVGPYFLWQCSIHQAYRLYEDGLDSFIYGVIPEDVLSPKKSRGPCSSPTYPVFVLTFPGTPFSRLLAIMERIPVPSYLYGKPTPDKPLAGARMGLKGIFRLEGTRLTMMSRPWTELYGPDEESAEHTKKLVALGAVIVGKTKMTSFASPEEPADQWVDFHCPVNPRGDRYQSPSSSPTGADTALAGHDWLDFSITGDSAGSVRAPAPCSGLFSLRPSFDSTSMKGVPLNSNKFDTVGQFGRSLDDLHYIVSRTFENIPKGFSGFRSKILYPSEFYPLANAKQDALTEQFISILEDFLGVKRTPFSFVEEWEKNPPKEAGGLPLLMHTEKSAFWALCYDYYHSFDSFRDEYKAKFGKDAFASSVVRFRWDVGKAVTSEEYETYLKELEVFREWFGEHVMGSDAETLSDAILVMPYGEPEPEYRDDPSPDFPYHRNEVYIADSTCTPACAPFVTNSCLRTLVAQLPYHSRISGRDEVRPIASTLIGAKGSDLMLIKLANAAFKKAFWPTSIHTGRYMYALGDNLRNVSTGSVEPPMTYEDKRKVLQEIPMRSNLTRRPIDLR